MPSVQNMLREGARRLQGEDARAEAEILHAHVLGVTRGWLLAHADDPVDPSHATAFRGLVTRRAAGEPIAYLIGIRGFHALDLEVTPDVLIPRPETELLVDLALQRIPVDAACRIADLGTGSGAVALAVAKARPRASILATDAIAAALAIARVNAARLGIHNVDFARGDWCKALGDARFDLIVSNPPYVADGDPHLAEGDLRFEPRVALASGADGMDAIGTIVRDAHAHLRASAWLLFEHGFDQGAAVRALLGRQGYCDVFTRRDLGNQERVTGGRANHGTPGMDTSRTTGA